MEEEPGGEGLGRLGLCKLSLSEQLAREETVLGSGGGIGTG